MPDEKKSTYNGYTNARKEANKRYMENFVEIKVRTTSHYREIVKNHASNVNESVNSFIIRAIDETITRDNETSPPLPQVATPDIKGTMERDNEKPESQPALHNEPL